MASLTTKAVAAISMTYTLHRLAAGSYDLVVQGAIVGTVVREVARNGEAKGWHAELLTAVPPLPAPFTNEAHRFDTLEATIAWLGGATIQNGG
ncbi:hypothetical protein MKK84_05800 [Methylobacterium sp. E-065]|uniref:hypothetical protein n=1 Tax=Methylobacterium sp. E-065 TaxID=2836583 RepID=UPI001FB9F0F1|nr:hypothetical protein [Methylobacterium sp. E-065]MCJ2016942.1 hypothetical protein [Methylobacterium sp. E-065]